mmetsp:Transcript_27729/g.92166  ORF Transcript_27729/g.92166 Transcript_27729/m.92166 type:complete len:166 (-) Transcript_27729:166-663(-)
MAGLDVHMNNLQVELIQKEERMRWSHAATKHRSPLREGGETMVTPRSNAAATPRRSAAIRFLEEKTGLVPSSVEYADAVAKGARPDTRELLYHGISKEGNGRQQYLKERKKYGVVERHGGPMTFAHTYGLETKEDEYVASPNCRKPIIQRSFFRTMGTQTHKDLP